MKWLGLSFGCRLHAGTISLQGTGQHISGTGYAYPRTTIMSTSATTDTNGIASDTNRATVGFLFVSFLAPLRVSFFSSALHLARRFLGAGVAFPFCSA